MVVTPDRPAADIVEFLGSDGQPQFTEKRLQQSKALSNEPIDWRDRASTQTP